MFSLGISMTAPEVLRFTPDDGGGGETEDIFAVQYAFQAGGVNAFFNTLSLSFNLSAYGRVKLRVLIGGVVQATSDWSSWFTNSGNIGSQCSIATMTPNSTYTAEMYIEADEAGWDDQDWTEFCGPWVQPTKRDPPFEFDVVIT